MPQYLATIEVRELFPRTYGPALTPGEIEAIGSDLPSGLEITSVDNVVESRPVLHGSGIVELSIWFQDMLPLFLAGFAGAAGKSAWTALRKAVARIVRRKDPARILAEVRFLHGDCPVAVKFQFVVPSGPHLSDEAIGDLLSEPLMAARDALPQAEAAKTMVDAETQVLEVDVRQGAAVLTVSERSPRDGKGGVPLSLEEWRERAGQSKSPRHLRSP